MQQPDIDNRFTYHPPTGDQQRINYEATRKIVKAAAETLNSLCPEGREKSLAITHLEEAVFWANAAIARAPGKPAVYAGPQYGVEKRLA